LIRQYVTEMVTTVNGNETAFRGRSKPSRKNPEGVVQVGLRSATSAMGAAFTVRKGSIFEDSHLPLRMWLQAIHLLCASKKGNTRAKLGINDVQREAIAVQGAKGKRLTYQTTNRV
jgi:hypothetical protein